MQHDEDHQNIRQQFVTLDNGAGDVRSAGHGEGIRPQAEDWQIMTAAKLDHDAENGNRQQQAPDRDWLTLAATRNERPNGVGSGGGGGLATRQTERA